MFQTLTTEGQQLLAESMNAMDKEYDDSTALLATAYNGHAYYDVRSSAHYALGLLTRDAQEDAERAERVINAVMACQYDCPDEVYHGTFKCSLHDTHPPTGTFPWRHITPYHRYFMDVGLERVANTFRTRLLADSELAPYTDLIERRLMESVVREFPVAWQTYDPNWREFILTPFAVILSLFADRLSAATLKRLSHCAQIGVTGAIDRVHADLHPLNTNIEIMHVFVTDFFGHYLSDETVSNHALSFARRFTEKYDEHHSVAEFNSPTYYGVDFTGLALCRRFGVTEEIRAFGEKIEAQLWKDFADFYNHPMQNVCGPFSRNYEPDMHLHSALPSLLFMGLGKEKYNVHPLNCESPHHPLVALAGIHIPAEVRERLLECGHERHVRKQFRELSERGMPTQNNSLCTATAWISDTLMIGAMAGSRNVSGQLRPLVVYWRDASGKVASMQLMRRDASGNVSGFHMAVFDGVVRGNAASIEMTSRTNQEVTFFFEFETEAAQLATITQDRWEIGNLRVAVDAKNHPMTIERETNKLRICYAAGNAGLQTEVLRFHLIFSLQNERLS